MHGATTKTQNHRPNGGNGKNIRGLKNEVDYLYSYLLVGRNGVLWLQLGAELQSGGDMRQHSNYVDCVWYYSNNS